MKKFCFVICLTIALGNISKAQTGVFEGQTDIGDVCFPGVVKFNPDTNQYQISASGANIWDKKDAFCFLWKAVSGDLKLTTDVNWIGKGKNPHRKAGWMIRQSLDANSPYVDAIAHGDGTIAIQYRPAFGEKTTEFRSTPGKPVTLMLERDGNTFSFSFASDGKTFHPAGAISVALTDPVYAGLAVCSHEANVVETAVLSNVQIENKPAGFRKLESTLEIYSLQTNQRTILYRAMQHFEAPNWSHDGKNFLLNNKGRIFTIPVEGGTPHALDTGEAIKCNNDHGLSPDGKWLAVSSQHALGGKSLIYILPAEGGKPRLVTEQGSSYWHGWSPDGKSIAYAVRRDEIYDIYTMPADGGKETRLTDTPGIDDGPDYSPDGKYIYFNSERSGLMKIWRMNADGTDPKQITTDKDYADWFPHPSPDGKWLVFLSYEKTVSGHPENQNVALRIMPLNGGKPGVLTILFGGQGTINVPSWSPDSSSFAFVSYRLIQP
jgi:Tol biopolymer transport system component